MAHEGELCFTVFIEGFEESPPPQEFSLAPGSIFKVGRATSNDVVLTQRGISSCHVELRAKREMDANGKAVLTLCARDVSMNGTGMKRFQDAPPSVIPKDSDEDLPSGAFLLLPLRVKDVAKSERAWLRVQYDGASPAHSAHTQPPNGNAVPDVSATAATAAPAPAPLAAETAQVEDPHENWTALDEYLDIPRAAPRSKAASAGRAGTSLSEDPLQRAAEVASASSGTQPVGFARKAAPPPPPPSRPSSEATSKAPKPLPSPLPSWQTGAAIGSTAPPAPQIPQPPPPPSSDRNPHHPQAEAFDAVQRKAPLPEPPKAPYAAPKSRAKAVLPSPPERPVRNDQANGEATGMDGAARDTSRGRRKRDSSRRDRRSRRSSSHHRSPPPEHGGRRRRSTRSRSPHAKPDWQNPALPPPPAPPTRDRYGEDRSHPAGQRELPWESNPPPSTWDGPIGGRRQDPSDWSSGGRRGPPGNWDPQPSRESQQRYQPKELPPWREEDRARSGSRGDKRRRRY